MMISALACMAFAQTVPNGDFEDWSTSDPPPNWTKATSAYSATQESSTVRNGSSSVNLTFTSTSTQTFDGDLISGISGDTSYTFSLWALDNDAAGRVTIAYAWFDSSDVQIGSWVYSNLYTSDSSSWQEVSHSNTSPSTAAKAAVRIRMYDYGSWDGDCTIYVDDVTVTGPSASPGVSDAFSSSSTVMKVVFDQDVDQTTAETPGNYTMSGVSFSDASLDSGDASVVWLTASAGIVGDASLDTLTVNNVQPAGGGAGCSGETADFFAGITPISVINQNDATFDGDNKVTIKGVVSANDAYNNVWIQDGTGAESGILIFDYSFDGLVAVGDEVTICCTGDVYNNLTELKNPILCSGPVASSVYTPIAVSASDIASTTTADTNPAELYEGCLVTVSNVTVGPSWDFSSNYDFDAMNGDDVINVDDDVWYHFGSSVPVIGGATYNITGVVTYTNSKYRISPRDASDIVLVAVPVELSVFKLE